MPSINAARACSFPGASRTERIEVESECWALVSEAATTHPLHEDRVGHSYLHAEARYEGQVGGVMLV
jgi:hypothetical protein